MLTVAEAAAILKVCPDTIYRMVDSGRLPHLRVGRGRGTIRIRESALDVLNAAPPGEPKKRQPRAVVPMLRHLSLD